MQADVFLNLQGARLAAGRLRQGPSCLFQYAPQLLQTGLQLSPLCLPPGPQPWQGDPARMDGLPGFVHDSLPDGWGRLLLTRACGAGPRTPALERLAHVGRNGMGALEYECGGQNLAGGRDEPQAAGAEIDLEAVARDAQRVLGSDGGAKAARRLLALEGAAGGARPKIACLVSADGTRIRSGTEAGGGFEAWLVKFAGAYDDEFIAVHEFIAMEIARRAGLDVPATRLFARRRGRGFFGVRRFDRTDSGKLHMVSLAGLVHCDFRLPCLDYESVMAATLQLCGRPWLREMMRRCVLNFLIGNTDDHAKNFSFLMDAGGRWRPSPVYDIVPARDGGSPEHMTAVLGEGRMPRRDVLVELGRRFAIGKDEVLEDIGRVEAAVAAYPGLAKTHGVQVPRSVAMRLPV